jgi:hypothetical protein
MEATFFVAATARTTTRFTLPASVDLVSALRSPEFGPAGHGLDHGTGRLSQY